MVKVLKQIIEPIASRCHTYIEPFLGGANSFSEIDHHRKIGNDINPYTIAMWNAVKNDEFTAGELELMRNVSFDQYNRMKIDCLTCGGTWTDRVLGYVGFACSYGGGWWNGYAHFNPNKNENHILEAYSGFMKQVSSFKNIKGCRFTNVPFNNMRIRSGSFIYCDPPYADTKEYTNTFDNVAFWKWSNKQVRNGNIVLVSEYTAPNGWVCIWSKDMQDGMGNNPRNRKVEKLFVHYTQLSVFEKTNN